MAATIDQPSYGTEVIMTVTNLQSLAIDTVDPFAGWQSDRVANIGGTPAGPLADDFEVHILLSTAATAPANDKAIYVYVIPWRYSGSAWTPSANFSTTTRPTGSEGTCVLSEPNSMKPAPVIPYVITSQPLDLWFEIGQCCGGMMPDGWSLAIRNNCGAALGTGCVVAYRPMTFTNT
jgi:hypothetical protein